MTKNQSLTLITYRKELSKLQKCTMLVLFHVRYHVTTQLGSFQQLPTLL